MMMTSSAEEMKFMYYHLLGSPNYLLPLYVYIDSFKVIKFCYLLIYPR